MPALKNKRHEAFAIAHAQGMSASDAYRVTYGTNSKNVDVLGPRLAVLVNVGKRIAEIQASAEHVTHLTIAEKRAIYALEGRDRRNTLNDRLKALKDDSELAKHIRIAPVAAGLNVTVNVVTLSEERRAELISKKREAVEWQRKNIHRISATPSNGNGTNGAH